MRVCVGCGLRGRVGGWACACAITRSVLITKFSVARRKALCTMLTATLLLAAATAGPSSVVQFAGVSLDFATTGAIVAFTDKKKSTLHALASDKGAFDTSDSAYDPVRVLSAPLVHAQHPR